MTNKILINLKKVEEQAIKKLSRNDLGEEEQKLFQLNRLRAGAAIMKIESGECPIETYTEFLGACDDL